MRVGFVVGVLAVFCGVMVISCRPKVILKMDTDVAKKPAVSKTPLSSVKITRKIEWRFEDDSDTCKEPLVITNRSECKAILQELKRLAFALVQEPISKSWYHSEVIVTPADGPEERIALGAWEIKEVPQSCRQLIRKYCERAKPCR